MARHRRNFRSFWTWKIRRGQRGRPAIAHKTRDLIRRICRVNPTWGAPRIHGEPLKLGIDIGESSVGVVIADGQRFGLHNLRHSLSNWLVNKAKIEPKTAQGILRHSKIQTTLDL